MSIQTPDWVKSAVFYQIFPDRFAKAEPPTPSPAMQVPLEPWESPPTLQGYKGGNLWGVIEKLDYLKDLGITAIYLTPIFQSACNHRYHTHDYYQVDPMLGGNRALKVLLDAAHKRGMKIVLDGVFNHASRGFFFFNDILENGPHSPWLDWFQVTDWPVSAYDGNFPANYVGWVDNRSLPKFNHENPQAREYIMRVGEYWAEFGIDGWRLDVPEQIEVEGFWQEFRDRLKKINPDLYIVGEIWFDASPWLDGTQFDGVMNYLFTREAIAFAGGENIVPELMEKPFHRQYEPINAAEYDRRIQHLLGLYDWEIQLTQMNLLSSHDVARLFTVLGGETEKQGAIATAIAGVKLCAVLLMTFPGAPSIYYGDEVGLGGGIDPDCRRVFPRENDWQPDITECYRELIQLRRRFPALQRGTYKFLLAEGKVYGFSRQLQTENFTQTILVFVNAGLENYHGKVSLDSLGKFEAIATLYGNGSELTKNQLALKLPARDSMILELKQ
ncbi:glycoside hydrolase family 13 protein [[Limnothrix rosea] IAM M-220]|uniref:glycoside hydrolase family 13 protein n=1 Tax=[Limnothrix rosea] IAM M-220 TaxID=454133 RepID=UPI00096A0612|nr:glycoside hydrolase family 13 protein [[Limnothrix rosea] IAM M-220]OKH19909.1 alpha-amylase [[Limnothrix rosea] IAM M-220]